MINTYIKWPIVIKRLVVGEAPLGIFVVVWRPVQFENREIKKGFRPMMTVVTAWLVVVQIDLWVVIFRWSFNIKSWNKKK